MTLFEQAQFHLSNYVEQKKIAAADDYFDLSIDAMCDHIDKALDAEEKLISVLVGMNISGISAKTSYGVIALSPSSKIEGLWQVTTFNPTLIPLGDLGVVKKEEAIKQFLSDLGHTIDVNDLCNQIRYS